MFIIIWEYQVKPEKQSEFEAKYSSDGAWVELFKKGKGYKGTELLQATSLPNRFITIDRWVSQADYKNFLDTCAKEYTALDEQYNDLTESESLIGKWETL